MAAMTWQEYINSEEYKSGGNSSGGSEGTVRGATDWQDYEGAGGVSTPLSGEAAITGYGDRSAWDNISGWLTGAHAFGDINRMSAPVTADWQAYDPNAPMLGETPEAQAARIQMGQQDQLRQRQLQLANTLQQQMSGQGPSVAENQLRAGLDRSQQAASALAYSDPRVSPAMAARQAQNAQGQMAIQANQQAAQLRAQEQLAAQQQMGALLSGARGQDIGLAGKQAELEQQTSLANQQVGMQGLLADQEAQMRAEEIRAGQSDTAAQVAMSDAERERSAKGGLIGMIMSLISDKRAKKNIRPGSEAVDEMLDSLRPYSYDYKDEKHGRGRQHGIMAQDAEKSEMGRSFVQMRPDGLRQIDIGRATMTAMAAMSHLHRRLKKLERK